MNGALAPPPSTSVPLRGVENKVETDPAEARYFTSYDHYGIHEEMLRDEVRTLAYRNAIRQSKHLFTGKVVLDVGCGTGILSMFAVQAGAEHVIGVDNSNIIVKAREIVEANRMSHKITLIQGKMEEITLPEAYTTVDIIISEWMGYFLLYESMLETVIYARDKYLDKAKGRLFPDQATIYLAGIEDADYKDEKFGFWDNVYGLDYSPMKEVVMGEPFVDTVQPAAVITDAYPVLKLDLATVTIEDLSFAAPFELTVNKKQNIHAILAWFDVEFTYCHPDPITLSTAADKKYTHWKQTVFYTDEVLAAQVNEKVVGYLKVNPTQKTKRDLEIEIMYKLETDDRLRFAQGHRQYKMYVSLHIPPPPRVEAALIRIY
ncbi:hypothetical protein AJ80_08056 [Polytolypa hystricis UAMH7299]|uniref:type I protein arginine methyltransferase n=1 Tax=Polytolypa hystricis (strain UAMH7299) TaxID=1447883 RepID=A0A2B7XEM5_POLH7|nr:hypothetical protein AJ80_08056 [Polytolypa hystricis UAMH7299]